MSACGICGDEDHSEYACELRLGNHQPPDQTGLLPQYRRCWTCRQITHAWDHKPCGQHSVPGAMLPRADPPPVTPHRDRTYDLQALARTQVAEARAAHPDLDAWFTRVRLSVPDHHAGRHHPDTPRDHGNPGHDRQQQQP